MFGFERNKRLPSGFTKIFIFCMDRLTFLSKLKFFVIFYVKICKPSILYQMQKRCIANGLTKTKKLIFRCNLCFHPIIGQKYFWITFFQRFTVFTLLWFFTESMLHIHSSRSAWEVCNIIVFLSFLIRLLSVIILLNPNIICFLYIILL